MYANINMVTWVLELTSVFINLTFVEKIQLIHYNI